MDQMIKRLGMFVVCWAVLSGGTAYGAVITAASCNLSDVQSALATAQNGDTVVVPAGTCTWTSGLLLSKAIKVTGSGVCGGYVGESPSLVPVGTGSRTFTTRAGLKFAVGEAITARYINREGAHSMTGTVTSYGGTSLTLNISSVTGSGSWASWVFERAGSTNIINSAVSAQFQPMIAIEESTAGSVEISCITFRNGTGVNGAHVAISPKASGHPVLIHDSWFQIDRGLGHGIYVWGNRGVLWRNSYVGKLCSHNSVCWEGTNSAVVVGNESLTASWTTPSTMGTADTGGTGNVYIEDSYMVGFLQSAAGTDSGGRMVLRNTIMNHAVIGTHGADTAMLGMRHLEVYNNEFIFHNLGLEETWNLNSWIYLRGGTLVATGNNMTNIVSTMWGEKAEIIMTAINLQRNAGPNPCWGSLQPGDQLHVPRQVGYGYVTGNGRDGLGRTNDSVAYVGDSEPVYVWSNSGVSLVSVQDSGGSCPGATVLDSSVNYIVQGRDYFLSAKPNYSPYPYPHPLATSGAAATPGLSAPKNLRISGF